MAKSKKNLENNQINSSTSFANQLLSVNYSHPIHSRQANLSLLYLLAFSILMFTLPFVVFYGVQHTLREHFHITDFANTCYSVMSAVITVNVIIIAYAIKAYYEKEYDDNGNEIDQTLPYIPKTVTSEQEQIDDTTTDVEHLHQHNQQNAIQQLAPKQIKGAKTKKKKN